MLGIRRTTVSIVAGNLEKAGAISCGRGYMQIVNREKLQRRSCECYGRDTKLIAQALRLLRVLVTVGVGGP
jgi:Crp-like helix-turn-helix domain